MAPIFPFPTIVWFHVAECHAEKWVHYLLCQDHSEDVYNQNRTISAISTKVLICLQLIHGSVVI